MSIEIPLHDQLTVEQAIAAANAAKRGAQQALAGIPAAIDAEVGPAAAPYITQASNAKDAALVAQAAAEVARDNAIAAERRMRTQSLGTFANDAAAVAWAAAQTPPITIVTGTSYLNSTTDVFRYAVVSAGPTITWHDVTEDEAAQVALASASAAAAAAVQADLNTRFLPAASTDWTFVGPSAPWAVGCRYRNTLLGVDKVWTGSAWERYDKSAQDASSAATGASDTATAQAGISTTKAGDATAAAAAVATSKSQIDASIASLNASGVVQSPFLLDGFAPAAIASFPKGLFALSGAVVALSSLLLFSSAVKYTTGPDGKLIQNAANGPAFSWINGRRQLVIEPTAATNYWLNSETEVQPGSIGAGILTGSIQAGYFGAVMGNRLTSVNGATANMGWKGKSISANETVSFDFLLQAEAGGITSMKAGIWGSVDDYGGNTGAGSDNIAAILSGPGAIAYAGGMVTISGLSTATPTKVRIWRTMANAQTAQGGFNVPFTAAGQTIMLGALNFQSGYGSSYIPCGATATARAADD